MAFSPLSLCGGSHSVIKASLKHHGGFPESTEAEAARSPKGHSHPKQWIRASHKTCPDFRGGRQAPPPVGGACREEWVGPSLEIPSQAGLNWSPSRCLRRLGPTKFCTSLSGGVGQQRRVSGLQSQEGIFDSAELHPVFRVSTWGCRAQGNAWCPPSPSERN